MRNLTWSCRLVCLPATLLGIVCSGLAQQTAPMSLSPIDRAILPELAQRRREQLDEVKKFKAFHDFQFTDRREDSGITFEHHAVDDAAKNWTAAHYDHGTGIALADVDGDGLLDIYFVNQIGG